MTEDWRNIVVLPCLPPHPVEGRREGGMIFFTDITTIASSCCLLNINAYHSTKKQFKDLIFIDPGVYELKKGHEYTHIQELHALVPHLAENEYISIDYPCDMNPRYTQEFIIKSIANNWRYASNTHYICTVQSKLHRYDDFKLKLEELEPIWSQPQKILGIGNLCRILECDVFTDYVFALLNKIAGRVHWMHFYGLPFPLMKYLPKLEKKCIISVDSTKWTRAVHDRLKAEHGLNCSSKTRNLFFLTYLEAIANRYNLQICY